MWQLVDTIRLQLYMLHKWSAVQVFIHIIDSTHKNCDTLSFGQVSWQPYRISTVSERCDEDKLST